MKWPIVGVNFFWKFARVLCGFGLGKWGLCEAGYTDRYHAAALAVMISRMGNVTLFVSQAASVWTQICSEYVCLMGLCDRCWRSSASLDFLFANKAVWSKGAFQTFFTQGFSLLKAHKSNACFGPGSLNVVHTKAYLHLAYRLFTPLSCFPV